MTGNPESTTGLLLDCFSRDGWYSVFRQYGKGTFTDRDFRKTTFPVVITGADADLYLNLAKELVLSDFAHSGYVSQGNVTGMKAVVTTGTYSNPRREYPTILLEDGRTATLIHADLEVRIDDIDALGDPQ